MATLSVPLMTDHKALIQLLNLHGTHATAGILLQITVTQHSDAFYGPQNRVRENEVNGAPLRWGLPGTASYFGLCTSDLNFLRQQAVKFLLKRHWLESEILPYVLRLVGIAPVLDPALVATVAATGLYFREGNTLEDLINMNLLPDGCNLRQRSVVHDLLWQA